MLLITVITGSDIYQVTRFLSFLFFYLLNRYNKIILIIHLRDQMGTHKRNILLGLMYTLNSGPTPSAYGDRFPLNHSVPAGAGMGCIL